MQTVKYFKGASIGSNDVVLAKKIEEYAHDKDLGIVIVSYTHDGSNTRALVVFED